MGSRPTFGKLTDPWQPFPTRRMHQVFQNLWEGQTLYPLLSSIFYRPALVCFPGAVRANTARDLPSKNGLCTALVRPGGDGRANYGAKNTGGSYENSRQ